MGSQIDVSGLGKLSIAPNANAPLLVVFGGRATLVKGQGGEDGMQTHLRTNAVAVGKFP